MLARYVRHTANDNENLDRKQGYDHPLFRTCNWNLRYIFYRIKML